MTTIKIYKYPVIDDLNQPEANLIEQVRESLSQFGFFYIKDTIQARVWIDKELKNLKDSVDVYYGEDAYTGEGSVFHGTYSRLDNPKNMNINHYFELISHLLGIISCALGYPKEFLQEVSQQENYGLYIYDREEEYMDYIKKADSQEISIAPHKDRSLITLIISIDGFEGYSQEYGWFLIPDIEGYLIVQVGTLLQKITKNKFKANIHRVRGFDSSKALFWSNLEAVSTTALICP
jgi:isopenicillin N synthase-like dioxygenase